MRLMSVRGRVTSKPIVPVTNMAEAERFYRSLGFDVEGVGDGYAWVRHAGAEILHLRTTPSVDPATNQAGVYLHVPNADVWHDAWLDIGAAVGDVADRAWGMREFAITDPSGNLIRVGHNL